MEFKDKKFSKFSEELSYNFVSIHGGQKCTFLIFVRKESYRLNEVAALLACKYHYLYIVYIVKKIYINIPKQNKIYLCIICMYVSIVIINQSLEKKLIIVIVYIHLCTDELIKQNKALTDEKNKLREVVNLPRPLTQSMISRVCIKHCLIS